MGRGIVEPVDDFRVTNPPSNEVLLQALADDFVKSGYSLKRSGTRDPEFTRVSAFLGTKPDQQGR